MVEELEARHLLSKTRPIGFLVDSHYRLDIISHSRAGLVVLEFSTSKFNRGGSCEMRSGVGKMNNHS